MPPNEGETSKNSTSLSNSSCSASLQNEQCNNTISGHSEGGRRQMPAESASVYPYPYGSWPY
uniref:Uncharacterized protein n=1 Tax=Meloidogyne artiellia TaxID=42426 RepID=Q8T375_MELAT|nr:hypothetical protein [Meloidogyne artiellia]